MIQAMRQRNDDTSDIEAREWDRLIYGDDYWMNRLATQASVDAISTTDAKSFVASLVRSGNIVVSVAGDFEPAEMEALLNKTVGSLDPLEQPLPAIPQPDHAPEPGVYVVNKADVNQGRVSIGKLGYKLGHPDQFALMVGNDILGGGGFTSRMVKRIRSDEGLAYSAGSGISFPDHDAGDLPSVLSVEVLDLRLCGRDLLRTAGHDARNQCLGRGTRTAKNSFIEPFPRRFASAGQIVGTFASDELLGRPHSYWTDYRGKVAAVDGDAARKALAKTPRPRHLHHARRRQHRGNHGRPPRP